MTLRFTRRVSLIHGLRLNASRGGMSLSIGHRLQVSQYAARRAAQIR
jgi:hypothetical protein